MGWIDLRYSETDTERVHKAFRPGRAPAGVVGVGHNPFIQSDARSTATCAPLGGTVGAS